MSRKDRLSNKKRELNAFRYTLEVMQTLHDRYDRPKRRLDKLLAAISEVGQQILFLEASVEEGLRDPKRIGGG